VKVLDSETGASWMA